jgi:hypothetical protein
MLGSRVAVSSRAVSDLLKGGNSVVDADQTQQVYDHLEIQSLLTRYCTAIDSKQYDGLDFVFASDAFIDYTSAGGIKGLFPEVKDWLETVLALFPMTQHVVANFDIRVSGDEATSRCIFYNPMGLGLPDGKVQMFFVGGYYNDKLVRTEKGWRITERIEESSWHYGKLPGEIEVPK